MEIIKTIVTQEIEITTSADLKADVTVLNGRIDKFVMEYADRGTVLEIQFSQEQVFALSEELNKLVAHIKSLNKNEPDINVQTAKTIFTHEV